jgi:hypothetical protein
MCEVKPINLKGETEKSIIMVRPSTFFSIIDRTTR